MLFKRERDSWEKPKKSWIVWQHRDFFDELAKSADETEINAKMLVAHEKA